MIGSLGLYSMMTGQFLCMYEMATIVINIGIGGQSLRMKKIDQHDFVNGAR